MNSERPILFFGEMVRAILAGRKTQTRRIMKPQPGEDFWPEPDWTPRLYAPTKTNKRTGESYPGDDVFGVANADEGFVFPYGRPGDRLWVKEKHWRYGRWVKNCFTKKGRQAWKFKSVKETHGFDVLFEAPATKPRRTETGYHTRPSIFMPRKFSRITLEIAGVRVERLRDISHRDALAEGVGYDVSKPDGSPLARYQQLWNSINGKGSWEKNPRVWMIQFKRV